jgi:ABC-2 type transport system ATP-binding protein
MGQGRIGYLPENCPVYPEMTVVDYLDFTASMRSINPIMRPAAIRRAIQRADLAEKARSPISTLSRGYRQRVGVAQALLHDPEILILDEPTNGLDPGQIEQMRGLIKALGEQATLLISTHILHEVEAVCDRVLILRGGQLALDARLDELRGQGLLLHCDAAPQALTGRLQAISGLAKIELQSEQNGHYRYRLEAQSNQWDQQALAARVASDVVAAGWQLFGLQPEEQSLEKLFHQITAGEEMRNVA